MNKLFNSKQNIELGVYNQTRRQYDTTSYLLEEKCYRLRKSFYLLYYSSFVAK